jgi:BMFP domain-containing protein YqiC
MATKGILDDLSRLATDAVGAAQGLRREVDTVVKSQMERIIRDMDIATREEVEVLRDMVRGLQERMRALVPGCRCWKARHRQPASRTASPT